MRLRLASVSVRRDRRVVLDIPELDVPLDGVTAVMGPNGSGKTTLLRVIAGLEREVDGTARIESGDGPARRPVVTMAFQRAPFLQGTVRRNLELALELRRVARPQWAGRLERAAGLLGVEHLLDRDAGALSGGEAHRVNVARALAVPADIVLLDEPFAGLDRPAARELLRFLPHALAEAALPVILVTHQPAEALRLASRALVLLDGRVAASGPLPDLVREPPGPAVAEILGIADPADGDDALPERDAGRLHGTPMVDAR